jgi:hypothetical protein
MHSALIPVKVIYTTTDWWKTCTGNNAGFASTNPLWIARYASAIGTLPAGWRYFILFFITTHRDSNQPAPASPLSGSTPTQAPTRVTKISSMVTPLV